MEDFVREMALDVMNILPEAALHVRPYKNEGKDLCYVVFSIDSRLEDVVLDIDCTKILFTYNPSESSIENIDLYLQQNYRGKGLARKLVTMMENTGRLLGCEKIKIDCDLNPKFWEHMKYTNVETGKNYVLEKRLF